MRQHKAVVFHMAEILFIAVTGVLFFLSLFWHCQTNLYNYEHSKTIESHTFWLYVVQAALVIAALTALFVWMKKVFYGTWLYEKGDQILFFACAVGILLAGLAWIALYDSAPVNDQRDVWEEALRIAGIRKEPFNTAYFAYFQRNRAIALLAALVLFLSGGRLYAFRLLNLAAALTVYCMVCGAAKLIWKNRRVSAVTSLLLFAFYPLFIYTTYIYGTLLSAAFCSAGLYMALLFEEDGSLRRGVWLSVFFALGTLAHQSAAIGLLAALIYLFVRGGRRKFVRNLLVSAAAAVLLVLSLKLVDGIYGRITGADLSDDAVPVSCTIYMGITSTQGAAGPGSQDSSYTEIFNENGRDGARANRDAMERIGAVLREYMTGERSLSFFLEKTMYQWLDPTFGARKTIVTNNPDAGDPPNSSAFLSFYDSPVRTVAFKLSLVLMLLVYFGTLTESVISMRRGDGEAAVLIRIYVLGGVAFQMIWESFSRYCFAYYIWLFPLAACGLVSCASRLERVWNRRVLNREE